MKELEKELEVGLDPILVMEEASRCLLCEDAPCSKDCPAQTDPGKFIRSVRFRNFKGAAVTIRTNNALGAVCARVCPTERYCQKGCSRSGIDKPIDIGRIQRFVTDFEEANKMEILESAPSNGKKVAIVGSGPGALQASVSLRTKGYDVTIYEKSSKAGGYLRYGIPSYRLPSHVLDTEIKRIEKLGVKFVLNTEIGKDLSIKDLEKDNDAVIISVGASMGKMLPLFKDNKHCEIAVDFLKELKTKEVKLPDNVLVIGGGDVAMDVSTSLRLAGVKHVNDVVYEQFEELKASKKELETAQKHGVNMILGYVPVDVKDNVVTFKHRELDSTLTIKADKIILAVGQVSNVDNLDIEIEKGEIASPTLRSLSNKKIFACGDLGHGEKTVVYAVRSGKEVAILVDLALGGK